MKPIQVGLLGIGTVGGGVFTVLERNQDEITRRAGRGIRRYVAAVFRGIDAKFGEHDNLIPDGIGLGRARRSRLRRSGDEGKKCAEEGERSFSVHGFGGGRSRR